MSVFCRNVCDSPAVLIGDIPLVEIWWQLPGRGRDVRNGFAVVSNRHSDLHLIILETDGSAIIIDGKVLEIKRWR